jgi:hypothetical protein
VVKKLSAFGLLPTGPEEPETSSPQNINEVLREESNEDNRQHISDVIPQKPVDVQPQEIKKVVPQNDDELLRYSAYFFKGQLQKLDRLCSNYYQITGQRITPSDILRLLVDKVAEEDFALEDILPARKVSRWKR